MKSSQSSKFVAALRRRPVLISVVLLIAAAGVYLVLRPKRDALAATAFYEVKRGDFTVSVVEGGALSAVSEVAIRSEVEGVARIISIVPEGKMVKKGELLIELDAASAEDQLNQQQINFEKAKFGVQQALAQLEIMRSSTNSDYLAARLKVRFANIDRDKYLQGQQLVDVIEASNKVVQIQAQLSFNKDTFINSTNLAAKGYETKQKVDGDRLTLLNSQNAEIVATNGVWMLQAFDIPKLREKYDSDVLQAAQELDRVVNQNIRKMAQYEADLLTQKNTLALSEQKLDRDRKNLDGTKIYAPQDGLVVYQVSENRFSSESLIEGGATVRNRQELIKLPDLSKMKVIVKVHESHVNMVREGLPAYVVLDSAPDQRFAGIVNRVAPLPDSQSRWGNPNLKVYNTEIHILDRMTDIKPGASAKAEIVITNISNTLSVPIQAVTTLKGRQVVYVQRGRGTEPRSVELGLFNTTLIEVTKGLKEGEKVMLSPPFDTQEKDLDGGVLAPGEKPTMTNRPAATPPGPSTAPGQTPGMGPITQGSGRPELAASPALGSAGGAQAAASSTPGQPGAGFNPQEMMKQFDKDGDGQLSESEREAMRTAMVARGGGAPGGFDRQAMMKRFDANGDGQLDETERAAMRQAMSRQQGAGTTGEGGERNRERRPQTGEPRAGEKRSDAAASGPSI